MVMFILVCSHLSIKLEPSSDSNNPQEITLLTPEERATATKALEGFRRQAVGCSFTVNGRKHLVRIVESQGSKNWEALHYPFDSLTYGDYTVPQPQPLLHRLIIHNHET